MAELLLELLSEDIPARMQARAADDLKRLVCEGLDEKRLGKHFSEASSFVTPRRLALVIDDLPERQMASVEVRMGPRSDAPEQAIKGFKGNLPKGAKVKVRETTKGTFLSASIPKSAQPTPEVLPEIVEAALAKLPWPKSMRWGEHKNYWIRPIHSILYLFDGETIRVTYTGVRSGNTTRGHRFLAPKPFSVKNFADYKAKLMKAYVVLDPAERRKAIWTQAQRLAKAEGLTVKQDEGLLAEVAGLVEWPVVFMGSIDESFMALPPEVLTTVMRQNQKYFSLLKKDGSLAPRFIVAADTVPDDGGKAIVAGNERVLRARLADAGFFWDQDRKVRLADRVSALEEIIFHEKLGRMSEKAGRMQTLAAEIAARMPGCDPEQARRAARLGKADLTTEMVVEFPELQGVMGRYYALLDGEPPEVADAIAEHYAPQGPDDRCPTAPVGVAVALADKIDTLVGFWLIGEKPTGSRDPFALRRAALGVIRLIIENKLRVPLAEIFREANSLYTDSGLTGHLEPQSLLDFLADRLKVHLREKGVRHDLISAVFALSHEDDLVRLLARVEALKAFLDSDDGANLLTAYKRASNIVRIEEKKDGVKYDAAPLSDWFQQDEEKNLHTSLMASLQASSQWLEREDFARAMSEFAKLRQPVDAFFDHVTVNCDDANLRENRLRLLSRIRSALDSVADFSRIEG